METESNLRNVVFLNKMMMDNVQIVMVMMLFNKEGCRSIVFGIELTLYMLIT
jgi:hypothetical protein